MYGPLITVVVPIYKVEKYLDRCINSLVNQSYQNLQIILVDDGSPDRCPEMCDAWTQKDDRIQVIHKKNAGLGMARNSGIEAAAGEYICFVDSDDYVDTRTIEMAYAAIVKNQAEIAVFGLVRVNAKGEKIKSIVPVSEKPCYRGADIRAHFLPDYIDPEHRDMKIHNLCLSAWSNLFSMDLIKRTNWRFVSEREMISEDSYSLIWLYQYVESVAIVAQPLYYYCENGGSLTQTYRADRFEKIKSFYAACTEMAEQAGYGHGVLVRISGLFLAFSIAAMKQVVAADMPHSERKVILNGMIDDIVMQRVLANSECKYRSHFRTILFWSMRQRLYNLVWFFVRMQLFKEGKG